LAVYPFPFFRGLPQYGVNGWVLVGRPAVRVIAEKVSITFGLPDCANLLQGAGGFRNLK
jgi:hypothetical protein